MMAAILIPQPFKVTPQSQGEDFCQIVINLLDFIVTEKQKMLDKLIDIDILSL
jgi:hypothetical protein